MAVRHTTEEECVVFRESEDLPLGWAFGGGERDGHTDVLRFSGETVNQREWNKSLARLWRLGDVVLPTMSSLAEIERAADVLRPEEKQELVMFLLTRLRGEGGVLPPVRDIPKEQIEKWVAKDEAGYQKFLAGA